MFFCSNCIRFIAFDSTFDDFSQRKRSSLVGSDAIFVLTKSASGTTTKALNLRRLWIHPERK